MLSEIEKLKEKFETEIWTYIDGSMAEGRKKFWDSKLNEHHDLQMILKETQVLLDNYDAIQKIDISEDNYEDFLDKAVSSKKASSLQTYLPSFRFKPWSNTDFYKLSFGLILIVVAVIVSLLSNKPNPINKISDHLLAWDDSSITEGISKVQDQIVNRDQQYKNYILYKISKDKWQRDISTIQKRITKMKNEVDLSSL